MTGERTPSELPAALFHLDGEMATPTALAQGPWDHGGQHGGAVTGILGHGLCREVAAGFELRRMTAELRAPAPMAPLRLVSSLARPGRRVAVSRAELVAPDGRIVAAATGQFAVPRAERAPSAPDPNVPPIPTDVADPGAHPDVVYPRPGFNCDAVELRCVSGTTEDSGPGVIWARLRRPVVAGHDDPPEVAMTALADLGMAVGWQESTNDEPFINTDVTLQLGRRPRGEFVCFDSHMVDQGDGTGWCDTVLSDVDGRMGRILQTVVENPGASPLGP